MKIQGVQHHLSTTYHPQTDGRSEVLNRCLENYLRCMCCDTPQEWARCLPLAEFWYNTTYHSASHTTPYEILYGQPPLHHMPYLAGSIAAESVDRSIQKREATIVLLKEHLAKARDRMKQRADKKRSERVLKVGDWVYLKLQPYHQHSLVHRPNQKPGPKYYGPYMVIKRTGEVAYTL